MTTQGQTYFWRKMILLAAVLPLATGVLAQAPAGEPLLAQPATQSALPQEAGPTQGGTAAASAPQEIIVTGSHIKGTGAPVVNVQTIDRALLEESGAAQLADLVKQIPSNTGTALYNESGLLSGTAQFSLRGLGFSSTLTLLNGRRAGVSPLSDRTGADFVDINQFPLAMIGRIDVLKDGASAIYGSEAVAGVVNLITRKGFEGLELSGDFASASNDAWSVNLAAGRRFDKGSINFYTTYYEQTGNIRSDFDWLIERVGGNGVLGRSQLLSTNGYPASWQRAAVNGAGLQAPVTGALLVPDPGCEAAGGVFAISDAGIVDRARCRFNFADQVAIVPATQRIQAFFESEFEVTDRISYFNEASLSRNLNRVEYQGGGFSNGFAANNLVFVPANHPFNFFTADPNNPRNLIYVDPAQWNNAIHTAVGVVAAYRPEGQYVNEDKRQTNTYLRLVNGMDFSVAKDWNASVSHQYAHAEFVENLPLAHNAPNIDALLRNGQYNPFATSVLTPNLISPKDGVSAADNSNEIINQIFYTSNLLSRTEQQVVDLATSGPIVELPTGAVILAAGGQYRTQSLKYVPDSLSAQGLASGSSKEPSFSGRQEVVAGYAEAVIPVFQRAAVQLAVRHEDYGTGIGGTTDPKITGRLNFMDGRLSVRGSWGTSFQAPTLSQGKTSRTIVVLSDPVQFSSTGVATCGVGSSGAGTDVRTSGANLEPQNSTNYNLGFDINPVPAIRFSADYWHYDYSNLIAAGQSAQSVINSECGTGAYIPDPRVTRTASGILSSVDTPFVNVGKVVTDGVDLSAIYGLSLSRLGELTFRADTTYVNKFDSYDDLGNVRNAVGSRNFNSNFAPMPQWRATARVLWSMSMHNLAVGLNFTDGYENDQSNNAPVSSFTTLDLQYAANFDSLLIDDGATTFTLGVNNALDKDPPALRRATANGQILSGTNLDFDRPGYDVLAGANIQGRAVFVRFKQTF